MAPSLAERATATRSSSRARCVAARLLRCCGESLSSDGSSRAQPASASTATAAKGDGATAVGTTGAGAGATGAATTGAATGAASAASLASRAWRACLALPGGAISRLFDSKGFCLGAGAWVGLGLGFGLGLGLGLGLG